MRSVSSKVMLPELPEAKMETRKPIGCSSLPPGKTAGLNPGATLLRRAQAHNRIFRMMAERFPRVNAKREFSTRESGAVEGEAVQWAENGDGDSFGAEKIVGQGLHLVEGDGLDGSEDFVERVEAAEVEFLAGQI